MARRELDNGEWMLRRPPQHPTAGAYSRWLDKFGHHVRPLTGLWFWEWYQFPEEAR